MPIVVRLIIWFWLTREPTAALLFTLHMAPAGLIDSVLKPLAMGKGLQTPILVIFVGVLGGTIAYGLPGLSLGPMILALAYELVAFWLHDKAVVDEDEATA
jgi:predicted PurR-regulated permease PerM